MGRPEGNIFTLETLPKNSPGVLLIFAALSSFATSLNGSALYHSAFSNTAVHT